MPVLQTWLSQVSPTNMTSSGLMKPCFVELVKAYIPVKKYSVFEKIESSSASKNTRKQNEKLTTIFTTLMCPFGNKGYAYHL